MPYPKITPEEEYEYYAFVSYTGHDIEHAKWLQNRLERYCLPSSVLKKHPELPKRLSPNFRDKTDIGLNPLVEELKTRLYRSRFLIVVCSPSSACATAEMQQQLKEGKKIDWVALEIQTFIDMGRADRIILFIVDGEPNSADPTKECLHPLVKTLPNYTTDYDTLIAANIHEADYRFSFMRRQHALIRVIARMHGLEFDMIWRRHLRYLRMLLCTWATGTLIVLGIMFWIYLSQQVFAMTLRLDEQTAHNPQLDLAYDSYIEIQFGDKWEKKPVKSLRDSFIFKDIAPEYRGKKVPIRWNSHGIELQSELVTIGETVSVPIARDDCFGVVRGVVRDKDTDELLAGVEVATEGVRVMSDAQGSFELRIPLAKQKKKYDLELSYKGNTVIFNDAYATEYHEDRSNSCYF